MQRNLEPTALVGLMHVNEPTVARARQSAITQRGVKTEVFEVEGLGEWAAHSELYRRFTERTDEFDILLKLDGDMILAEPWLLRAGYALFTSLPEVDQLSIGVDDWFTLERIDGMSMWRGGVRWEGEPDRIRPDLIRSTSRGSTLILDIGTPLVLHGMEPTADQALRYGAHRGVKARATLKRIRLERARAFAVATMQEPHPMRLLALAAMDIALRDVERGTLLVEGLRDEAVVQELEQRSRDPALGPEVLRQIDELAPEPTASNPTSSRTWLRAARWAIAASRSMATFKDRVNADSGQESPEALLRAALESLH